MAGRRADGVLGKVAAWVNSQEEDKKPTRPLRDGVKEYIQSAMSDDLRKELEAYLSSAQVTHSSRSIIKISKGKTWHNSKADTMFLPIDMTAGSASCEEEELKVGNNFDLPKGKSISIRQPVVFIYQFTPEPSDTTAVVE